MAERIFWRLLAGVEAVVYGPPSVVSGWFRDDPGYGGRDLLADRTETRGGALMAEAVADRLAGYHFPDPRRVVVASEDGLAVQEYARLELLLLRQEQVRLGGDVRARLDREDRRPHQAMPGGIGHLVAREAAELSCAAFAATYLTAPDVVALKMRNPKLALISSLSAPGPVIFIGVLKSGRTDVRLTVQLPVWAL